MLLACAAALAVGFGLRPHHEQATLAVSRVPAARAYATTAWLRAGRPWSDAEVDDLRGKLAPLAGAYAFPAQTGLLISDGRSGRVLYSRNSRVALVPGSTIKLVTAAAALEALGPDHRFETSIVTDATEQAPALAGSIWLVGGGDPELTSDDLRRGVHELQLAGIERITGDVYGDGSRYGPDRVNPDWDPDDLEYGWAAPASALSVDGGSVQFTITPHAGEQASVDVDPPGTRMIAAVDTVDAYGDNTLRIDLLPNNNGYAVRGQIPYGAPQKYWRAVPHPTQAAAVSLLAMLRLAGVDVLGSAMTGIAPQPTATLWRHQSRPLDAIVRHMFFLSDNHYAEELLRAVGYKASGLGDLHNSLAAERAFLHAQGIPTQGLVLADGSGLSPRNRLTALALGQTLEYVLKQPLPLPAYSLLPRAGLEGTVAVRDDLDPGAKGRVFAKDGYIEGASAIAGYVLTAHHGPVIFVFLVNDWQNGLDAVWSDEDQMLDIIAAS
ncbi:MAG: D-alanyl-D-alanine carboxypeptidase/D-alanyl-D-alanine-endopeptidase [Candidatus Eremiobacteraeota bacterium]|nr:D-alanyl-D-alanine carboxypeptidase/D-alanyl-D-alanine-endopeptidase [Candidatus Eremiobacteraeota bacterium]